MKACTAEPGGIVLSRAGRDRNRAFLVVDVIDEAYVLIADGALRTLQRPKKKKRKHLLDGSEARMELGPHTLDADIRTFLRSQGFSNDRKE